VTIVRFGHLLGITLFVGGQLALVVAIAPVLRGRDEMRAVARRFGIASAVALTVIVATGAAMASHYDRWGDPTLHAKLALLALIFVLTGLHVVSSARRAISLAITVLSVALVYLGVALVYG